jgi:hypothetical protein
MKEGSYSKKLLKEYQFKHRLFILVVLVIVVSLLAFGVFSILISEELSVSNIIYLIYGIFIGYIFKEFGKKVDTELDSYVEPIEDNIFKAKLGDDGEIAVFNELDKILDKNKYKIFPNFIIPGRNFDIDAIVLGPKGLIMFEIKNPSGNLFFSGENTLICHESGKKILQLRDENNPIKQVLKHEEVLKNYISNAGFKNLRLLRALIVVSGEARWIDKPKVYLISGVQGLKKYFEELPNDQQFTEEFCSKLEPIFK